MRRITNQKNFVEKLKKQNEKALEYVIHQYGGFVKAVVQRNLSGMPEEIEECMDDVFLDVWNHIDRFDDTKGTFLNWMLSIARFRSIDYLRRYSRICMEEDISRFENHLAKDQLLEMLEQEISKETEALLEGLCAQDRDILLRYYMEDTSAEELAEDYGVSKSTIYSRVSRAKQRVRMKRLRNEV